MNKLFLAVGATGAMFVAQAGEITRPDVPDNLKAPAGEEVTLVGHATGVQIYVCQAGANPPFAWVFKAPEADLHFAGPTWKHIDGSEVVGRVAAKQDAPKPGAIPWLLLTAASHTGQGVLNPVTSIQRIHTEGGVAPNANTCDASRERQGVKDCVLGGLLFLCAKALKTRSCASKAGGRSRGEPSVWRPWNYQDTLERGTIASRVAERNRSRSVAKCLPTKSVNTTV